MEIGVYRALFLAMGRPLSALQKGPVFDPSPLPQADMPILK